MLNKEASDPEEIVTVADSETLIVAAVADVAMFSAAEKEEEEVKVGAVVSDASPYICHMGELPTASFVNGPVRDVPEYLFE